MSNGWEQMPLAEQIAALEKAFDELEREIAKAFTSVGR